jgi:hypothetical protein
MGGNALKNYKVARLQKNDYLSIIIDIEKILDQIDSIQYEIIPSFRNKESFGDLDILYSSKYDILPKLKELVKPIGCVHNGPCFSFTFPINDKLFQIDLIKVPFESFNFALNYFGYNDFGNLLGRLVHYLGLTLGHDGLKCTLRDPDNPTTVIKQIIICRNFDYVLKLLHLPTINYYEKFNDLTDIFDFVMMSPYFHKDIFLLENRNNTSRVRDRKRTSYNHFLKYINNIDVINENEQYAAIKKQLRINILYLVKEDFPNFKNEYDAALEGFYYAKKLKEKYNGLFVSEWTGLSGKELGKLMQQLKTVITPQFIENNSIDDIKKLVLENLND